MPPVPSMLAAGKERAARRVGIGGRSERASHHGIMREASPFEHRPSGARRDTGWHATRACFFRPKACQYAPFMGMTRFASPRVRRPAAPRLLSSSPCAGRPASANGLN